ncbi:hypothetical protein DFH29DRAFT_558719 [Suillus ampliporus]|nr:hypothetical protein DFH29DRAFT_558719 [Suillus ampliporus]
MIHNYSSRNYGHARATRLSAQNSLSPTINIQNLPDEVLFVILEFVDVLDVVVLYKVSKLFHRLLHDELYWRKSYEKRRIPRPPGPFKGQSTTYLREILVRSARVQRNWPPFVRSPNSTSRVTLQSAKQNLSIIHGRWLITGDSPLILCYDTCSSNPDWNTSPQIFYRPHLQANFFSCFSTTAEDGQELIFAVSETQVGAVRRKLNLFTIEIDPDYGPFISGHVFTLDVQPRYSGVWDCHYRSSPFSHFCQGSRAGRSSRYFGCQDIPEISCCNTSASSNNLHHRVTLGCSPLSSLLRRICLWHASSMDWRPCCKYFPFPKHNQSGALMTYGCCIPHMSCEPPSLDFVRGMS